jgi:hypothetical protein
MTSPDPAEYLGERIREAVATDLGQLGLQVDVSPDRIILRGRLDSEPLRVQVVRRTAQFADGRRVVDEMERPQPGSQTVTADPERIEP